MKSLKCLVLWLLSAPVFGDSGDDLKKIVALQQAQIQFLKNQIMLARPPDAPTFITGRMDLVPYKKTQLLPNPTKPLTFPVAYSGDAPSFPEAYSPTISVDNWDWGSDYAWSNVAKPAGAKSVWARISLSLVKDGTFWFHHDCTRIRREYSGTNGVWKPLDDTIDFGCLRLGGSDKDLPGTATFWIKWWDTDLKIPSDGWGPKRLRIVISNPNGNPAGIRHYIFAGMTIELFAEYS